MTDVISIQSQVVHGHVGNSAAVFPMQAKGLTVAAVPTALLSNHPHYPTMHGRILDSELVEALLRGVEERGLLESARVVLTGYLGSVENGVVIASFIERALSRHSQLQYVCDPVMGDDDLGIFVREGLVDLFRDRLVPLATLITPNQYELELLTQQSARSDPELRDALQKLRRAGTQSAVVTGGVLSDTIPGEMETLCWSADRLSRTSVERVPIRPCGTGDLFTGLLTARICQGMELHQASRGATHEILAVLHRTQAVNAEEMAITGFDFSSMDAG
jgi:pyridoxine kinase